MNGQVIMEYFIQGIGILGFIVGIIAFNFKEDNKMKISMGISSLLLSIHFLLLEAMVLFALKAINTFRNIITIKYSSSILLFIFLIIYWIVGFYFSKDLMDWLPIITITISTIAMFKLKGIALKIGFLPANIVWIIMSIHTGSIGGFLLEFSILIVNLKTIYQMKNQNDK